MIRTHSFITGGAGFIGSHLAELLLDQGHRVTVLDDLSTGRYANVAQLEGRPGFTLIIDSVLNERLTEELIRDCDRLYHLASAVGVKLILFAHVADICGAIARMLDIPSCFGQVVNLGNDEEVSINRLAQLTIELTHSQSEICHISYDEAYGPGFEDMQRRVPSLERARNLLGYQPKRGLRDIIHDVAGGLRRAEAVAV